jgi:hypothetical protein
MSCLLAIEDDGDLSLPGRRGGLPPLTAVRTPPTAKSRNAQDRSIRRLTGTTLSHRKHRRRRTPGQPRTSPLHSHSLVHIDNVVRQLRPRRHAREDPIGRPVQIVPGSSPHPDARQGRCRLQLQHQRQETVSRARRGEFRGVHCAVRIDPFVLLQQSQSACSDQRRSQANCLICAQWEQLSSEQPLTCSMPDMRTNLTPFRTSSSSR